jgi:hypothetical protein
MNQSAGKRGLLLTVDGGVDDLLEDVRLFAAPFLDPNRWAEWVRGSGSVTLLPAPTSLHEQTAFVTLRVQSRTNPDVERSWIQWLELAIDTEQRDRALLGRYIGTRFRDWLRSSFEGIEPAGGRDRWDDKTPGPKVPRGPLPELFTLEPLLQGWARDPLTFEARVPKVIAMLPWFQEAFEALPDDGERAAALKDLATVRPFLTSLEQTIAERVP